MFELFLVVIGLILGAAALVGYVRTTDRFFKHVKDMTPQEFEQWKELHRESKD